MYGKLNSTGKNILGGIAKNPDCVRILAIVKEPGFEQRYVIEARWSGCTNPATYSDKYLKYIDPSLDKKEFDIQNAYWVSGDIFEITWHDYKTNLEASKMLSSEY